MQTLARIRRCLRIEPNDRGRDYVVGDLHGHRTLLDRELQRLGFDPRCDRVFSVGDLIDRGPDSLDTLALIEQPWFHAVLGNHELLLLDHLGYFGSRIRSRDSDPSRAAQWIGDALARRPRMVRRLADLAARLPLMLHVQGVVPFNVLHGDLHPIDSSQPAHSAADTVTVREADAVTSSRFNIAQALRSELVSLQFAQHTVRITRRPFGSLPTTFVGHSPVVHITVHNSYVYVDQGMSARTADRSAHTPPTVLDPVQFAYWLKGVAAARAAPTPGTPAAHPDAADPAAYPDAALSN